MNYDDFYNEFLSIFDKVNEEYTYRIDAFCNLLKETSHTFFGHFLFAEFSLMDYLFFQCFCFNVKYSNNK